MERPKFSVGEALQLGYNFLLSHTDVVLRKVLRIWRRKVGGTKMERVVRGYLFLRLCLRGGREANDVLAGARGKGARCSCNSKIGCARRGQMSMR